MRRITRTQRSLSCPLTTMTSRHSPEKHPRAREHQNRGERRGRALPRLWNQLMFSKYPRRRIMPRGRRIPRRGAPLHRYRRSLKSYSVCVEFLRVVCHWSSLHAQENELLRTQNSSRGASATPTPAKLPLRKVDELAVMVSLWSIGFYLPFF